MKLPWTVIRKILLCMAAGACCLTACSKSREVQIGSFKAEIPSVLEWQDSYWDLAFEPSKRIANELLLASQYGNEKMVEDILELREDIDQDFPVALSTEAKDEKGWTPLMWAVHYNHEGITEKLLRAGANPDARGDDGVSALALAVRNNNYSTVDLLLQCDPLIDVPDLEGVTPLMLAVASNNLQLVKKLLKRNASPDFKNTKGYTAIKIARDRGNWRIVRELLGGTEWSTVTSTENFVYDLGIHTVHRINDDSLSAWLKLTTVKDASSPSSASDQEKKKEDRGSEVLNNIMVQCHPQKVLDVKSLYFMSNGRSREEKGKNQWDSVVPGSIGESIVSGICEVAL